MNEEFLKYVLLVVSIAPLAATLLVPMLRWPRRVFSRDCLANVFFPLSQLAIVVVLDLTAFHAQLSLAAFATLAAIGVLCAALDAVLLRALRAANEKRLAELKVRFLKEQVDAQQVHLERLMADVEQARDLRDSMLRELARFDAPLAAHNNAAVLEVSEQLVDLASSGETRYCEHAAVDALLSVKARVCAQAGIDLDARLDVPRSLPVEPVDLCALFANLIDNSIAGCMHVDPAQRFISLWASVRAGFFIVEVRNSCLPRPNAGRFVSSRDHAQSLLSEHGWGLDILQGIAKRYDGSFSLYEEEGVFTTALALNIATAKEGEPCPK